MIAETTYNLGGWNTFTVYPNEIYEYERGTTVYTGRLPTWTGKIALAYPSDYGYAADLNQCVNKQLNKYNDSTCTSNNWMKSIITNNGSNHGWLLTPHSNYSYNCVGCDFERHYGTQPCVLLELWGRTSPLSKF